MEILFIQTKLFAFPRRGGLRDLKANFVIANSNNNDPD
jgi:hypothetical protein